ncbi:MAG: enoyl-CoA hydratase-related protein [Eubacteriales bacterium]|nr:enoyl-CoA hydratase-related protein [Eubacteriales bacterium]MDD3536803.1 enoyl-CoA hydratase-related protein [Eubacteriales bacterium]MDD4286571.1 enoyl-CoA hydratase-related protein [Eubacteriales bacterium]NLV69853.1 enoyl-CoA hydratase/isomerase family protein [Clostridiales bacterium]
MVRMEKTDGVGIIRIDRPEAMNSLNEQVLKELDAAVEQAENDPDVKAVIITGEGKAFVAGADIAEMQTLDENAGYAFGRLGQQVFRRIEIMDKVVIAAVNGYALGGGCELAMACDIRIAGEKAKFGQPEVGLGIIPGYSGTQRLPRLVGKGKAMELIVTGAVISAETAEAIGLVNKVVSQDAVLNEALSLAKKIGANAPLAVSYAKKAIREGLEISDMDQAIQVEAVLFGKCFATSDQKEGMTAFLEKRKPEFTGK